MTVAELASTNGHDLTDAEARAAAAELWRRAEAAGEPLTGVDLGRAFGKTDRWGRKQIERARASAEVPTVPPTVSGTPARGEAQVLVRRNDERPAVVAAGTVAGSGTTETPVAEQSRGTATEAPVAGRSLDPEGMWSRRMIRWVTVVAVLVVAACAARSSYEHQRTVVEMAGEHHSAWYMPLSVDGMMLIASLNMLVRRWDGEGAGALTWTALLLGGAASLAANIAAAEPSRAPGRGVEPRLPDRLLRAVDAAAPQPCGARRRAERAAAMNGMWGELARDHWQHHLPNRYAALEDPDWYFDQLDQEASSYYLAIRDGQLKDINPNNATIGWAEFLKRVAWANQTARDIVATELIYLPGEDTDDNQADGDEREGPDW